MKYSTIEQALTKIETVKGKTCLVYIDCNLSVLFKKTLEEKGYSTFNVEGECHRITKE